MSRESVPWNRILVTGILVLFIGYWLFVLQSDFRTFRELSKRHETLSHLLRVEREQQEEYQRERTVVQRGGNWEKLIREGLRYVKPGEIVVRPVWVSKISQPVLKLGADAKP